MTDIQLDPVTHDIILGDDLLLFTDPVAATIQRIKMRLLLYKGEWLRDVDVGVPYLQEIFESKNTKDAADANIKSIILSTDNVNSLRSYTSSVDQVTRTLKIIFSATTDNGDPINNIEVEI